MAKRINKNLVVGLTMSLMFATTASAVWMLANLRDRDPDIYVQQALHAAQRGNHKLEHQFYMRAHRAADRKVARYLVYAGHAAMKSDDAERALRRWTDAVTLEPTNIEAQEAIVRFHREFARNFKRPTSWEELRKQAERLVKLDDASAMAHNAHGLALLGLKGQDSGNLQDGRDHLIRALELSPDNADYANDLARFYDGQGDAQKARSIFLSFLEANHDSAEGMRFYAEYLIRSPDHAYRAESWKVLDKAIQLHPHDADLHLSRGRYWFQRSLRLQQQEGRKGLDDEGRTPDDLIALARESLTRAIEIEPDEYTPYIALGGLYRRHDPPQYDKALKVYEARFARPMKSRSGFMGMINRRHQFDLYAQAVQTVLATYVPTDTSKKQKVRNEEILQKAQKYLALAVSELGAENATTHLLRGKILRFRKKTREAIRELELARKGSDQTDPEVGLILGELYYRDGQLGVAYKAVRDAVTVRPDIVYGWVLLASISLALDQPPNALQWAQQALSLDPDQSQARLLKAQALVKLGRIDEVPEELKKLLSTDDANRAKIQEALIYQLQGQSDKVIALTEEVLKASPAYPEAVRIAVVYYQQAGDIEQAKRVVNDALETDPKNRNFKVLQIDLEVEDPAERDQRLLDLISRARNPGNRAIMYFNFYVSRRNVVKAIEYLNEAESYDPESPAIVERQYRLALATADWERAEKYAAKAGRLNLDGANGEFFRGRILLTKKQYRRAIEVLRGALNTYPSHSDGYVWLGVALQAAARPEEATQAFQSAIAKNPSNGLAHRGLALEADNRGDEDALYKHLEQCEKYLPNNPWVVEQLQLKLEKEDPLAGIDRREDLRRRTPTDLDNLSALAGLYVQVKNFNDAVAVADEMLQVQSTPRIVENVSQIYSEAGRTAEAEAMLRKLVDDAHDGAPKADAQLRLARHYQKLATTPEEFELVEQAYLDAATHADNWEVCYRVARWFHKQGAETNDDQRLAKAVEWYRRGRDRAEGDMIKASFWRYGADALLAARDFTGAKKQIEQYLAAYPAHPRGLLYKGEVDMQLGQLNDALDAFDRFLEIESDSAVGYFRRGILHYARSDWDKAIADLTRVKALQPAGFGFLHRQRLASALESRGDVPGAIAELQSILNEIDQSKLGGEDAVKFAKNLAGLFGKHRMLVEQEAFALRYKNLMPDDPDWFTILGQNALYSGKLYSASKYLQQACRLSNYDSVPVDAAMVAWLTAEEFQTAIDFASNTVPAERRDTRLHLRWGQALAGAKRSEEALEHFSTAMGLASDSAELSSAVAVIMSRSLGAEESLAFARQVHSEDPQERRNKIMLASLLQQTPNGLTEATELWQQTLASSTDGAQKVLPLTSLAQLTYALKDFDSSSQYYQTLLDYYQRLYLETPDSTVHGFMAGVLNNLAYLLAEDMNRPELALPHAQEASRIARGNAPVLDTLGWVHVLLGNYREAIGALTRAIELDQEAADFHFHIAEAYAREGHEMDSAIREFQRAYDLARKRNATELADRIDARAREFDLRLDPAPPE